MESWGKRRRAKALANRQIVECVCVQQEIKTMETPDAENKPEVDPVPETEKPQMDPTAGGHPPFSLVPFDCREMTFEEYSARYQGHVMEKLKEMWARRQQHESPPGGGHGW